MGCASSTPMIATAGSEMLKQASHVATDAAKSAEDAAQDVTHALGQKLDNAKETVTDAMNGIGHELETALKEKGEMLDEAKNNLLEKLHLGGGDEAHKEKPANDAAETETTSNVVATVTKETSADDDDPETPRTDEIPTRAPTPAHDDADSLKTSTPEPEIEQALANYMADSPPTPKPTFAELEQLTKVVAEEVVPKEVVKETMALAAAEKEDVEKKKTEEHETKKEDVLPAAAPASTAVETERPQTTEWEKYADMLCQHRKYNPSDAFKRGGKFRSHLDMKRTHSHTDLRQLTDVPKHLPKHVVPSYADIKHAAAATTADHKKQLSESKHALSQTELSRPTALGAQRLREHSDSGLSDSNTTNNYNSPLDSNRSSAHSRDQLPLTLNAVNKRKFQREFASLIALEHKPPPPPTTVDVAVSQTPLLAASRAQSAVKTASKSASKSGSVQRTPHISRSSTRSSLFGGGTHAPPMGRRANSKPASKVQRRQQLLPPLSRSASRARSPQFLASGRNSPQCLSRSSARQRNTSSFLSSPRGSPFSTRRNYSTSYAAAHAEKTTFVADLSSLNTSKNRLTPSPYKMRERCAVCYNKYVIK